MIFQIFGNIFKPELFYESVTMWHICHGAVKSSLCFLASVWKLKWECAVRISHTSNTFLKGIAEFKIKGLEKGETVYEKQRSDSISVKCIYSDVFYDLIRLLKELHSVKLKSEEIKNTLQIKHVRHRKDWQTITRMASKTEFKQEKYNETNVIKRLNYKKQKLIVSLVHSVIFFFSVLKHFNAWKI